MTNAFGSGVPPEALEGLYSLMSWYYDMKGFPDANIVKSIRCLHEEIRKGI